ncbi:hypothetical protein SAMN02746041_01690 [Desulfacinum hydrothermale DSM 13146]|uniref:Uncharacterized protein n=1 Tax=Desulfacinum hydrothermale DSM 13146 TaxID=1121390 RepID=A0A1W1XHR1_9BACT|nr:hypothetical protein [Desulfacinum hydrothermale]SMC23314.1 hypothetical protein SAMN02746041_01690 [Desulfacinum hydrothermale DSM 13146]
MKRTTLVILLAVGMMLLPMSLAFGGSAQDAYYRECVDKRIANCNRKANLAHSVGCHLRECARKAQEEAAYLKANRERLIREMKADNVETVEYKVNYRLIRAFVASRQ